MIALAEIEAARERLAGTVVRTPLVRLEVEDAAAAGLVYRRAREQGIGTEVEL